MPRRAPRVADCGAYQPVRDPARIVWCGGRGTATHIPAAPARSTGEKQCGSRGKVLSDLALNRLHLRDLVGMEPPCVAVVGRRQHGRRRPSHHARYGDRTSEVLEVAAALTTHSSRGTSARPPRRPGVKGGEMQGQPVRASLPTTPSRTITRWASVAWFSSEVDRSSKAARTSIRRSSRSARLPSATSGWTSTP